ncbi:colicin immunity protein ImmE2 [Salmonella enterica subsp. arizonae]|uniref:Colicin immunity protein ImmE2 n=1 Tax=Salmonella enterica subsp. arizonae TaxID=59203 RepID=A0A2X4THN9_SALER|nr:colicin immunity protein ImmE2 [Salmonella enterica subsp. arizonae]
MTASYKQLNDYTENEFIQFVTDIVEVNSNSEEEHHALVSKFEELVQHPRGNGLIYYPEDGEDDSPGGNCPGDQNMEKIKRAPIIQRFIIQQHSVCSLAAR